MSMNVSTIAPTVNPMRRATSHQACMREAVSKPTPRHDPCTLGARGAAAGTKPGRFS